jgi:acetoin utilization deacetylase AcuC-like enzyme
VPRTPGRSFRALALIDQDVCGSFSRTVIVVRGDRAGDSPSWTLDRLGRRVPALEGGARTEEIEAGLAAHEGVRTIASDVPDDEVRASLAIVHEPEYLEFLDLASGQATPEHPVMAPDWSAPGVPADTPVCAGSAAAARSAVRTALTAARALQRGSNVAYALCRPPGHHAGRRSMGGYCYLNNAAAAVARLRAETGVAVGILDIDFHYGNGTASIVADMADVWLESIHASTTDHFPWRNSFPPNPRHRHHEYDNSPSAGEL